jgi:hypothetical protein
MQVILRALKKLKNNKEGLLMSSCCSSNTKSSAKACPQCTAEGKSIPFSSVLHQVKFPDVLSVAKDDYFFCSDESCSVGYFSQSGATISKLQLRAFEDPSHTRLCYCYDISKAQYSQALKDNTAQQITDFVKEQTKAGACACEIRNPSGQCCLANFKRLEKTSEKSCCG